MVTYMPRDAWTSTGRGGDTLTGAELVGVAVHWPGSTTDAYGVESQGEVAGRLRGWREYHVDGRGWSDVGYNFAGDQAGRVWDLRGLTRVGAHCASPSNPDANHEWLGYLFILGDSEQPSDAMIAAFQHWRHDVFLDRWPGRHEIRGHRQVPGAQTACPGGRALALVDDGTLARQPMEDDMPTADEIADAVWAHDKSITQPRRAVLESAIGGTGKSLQTHVVNLVARQSTLLARVGGLEATVAKLATGQALSAEEITSAARVGAGAALDERILGADVELTVDDGE